MRREKDELQKKVVDLRNNGGGSSGGVGGSAGGGRSRQMSVASWRARNSDFEAGGSGGGGDVSFASRLSVRD